MDIHFFKFTLQPKGKPGTKGQKAIVVENEATLKFYFYIIVGSNVSINVNYTLITPLPLPPPPLVDLEI